MNMNQRRPLSSTPSREVKPTLGLCKSGAAQFGITIDSHKENKGEWNECTVWTVNEKVTLTVMKGERPDWSVILDQIDVVIRGRQS